MTLSGPDRMSFESTYNSGKSQIVHRWLPSDLETPVSAFLKLRARLPSPFLLESVEGGAVLGRYSAIGIAPDMHWRVVDKRAETSTDGKNWSPASGIDPVDHLKKTLRDSRIDVIPDDLPPMAASGLFGYLGYAMAGLVEKLPDANPDTLNIPDALMVRPSAMLIFDNVRAMACLSVPVRPSSRASAADAYEAAQGTIETVIDALRHAPPPGKENRGTSAAALTASMTREAFHNTVHRAVEYIRAGDIFQVVPSLRFSMPYEKDPFSLYRALRRINPSPFLFHFDFGGFALTGSSPEIMVRVRNNTVTIRPIAGTRKRGATAAEDEMLAKDLLADPKERAEHLMLLDLGRNDVGRVAEIGSVRVTEQFVIEHYSHVMHIVSNVEGALRRDCDPIDALFAGFPAGTVSGAPKIRAMEIIDELEPERRGFYGGCVGYLDGQGNVDTCITLRTALIKDGTLYAQAGAGIVADSDPESEYRECQNKARAIIQAAEE